MANGLGKFNSASQTAFNAKQTKKATAKADQQGNPLSAAKLKDIAANDGN